MCRLCPLIEVCQTRSLYSRCIQFFEGLNGVQSLHRSINVNETQTAAYFLALALEHKVVVASLRDVIRQGVLHRLVVHVRSVDGFELIDEKVFLAFVRYAQDQISVAYDCFCRIE